MEEFNKIFETRDGWFLGLTSQELELWKNKGNDIHVYTEINLTN